MAIKTDDCDISEVYIQTTHGNNGDYYLNLYEYPNENTSGICNKFHKINYRMAMSGGFTSRYPEVRKAFVALFRAMEEAGLNKHPKEL
jgi:hypothetical protein